MKLATGDGVEHRAGKEESNKSNAKALKAKKIRSRVTPGRNIGMKEIRLLVAHGMMGRFSYRALGAREILSWVEDTWHQVLDYSPDSRERKLVNF